MGDKALMKQIAEQKLKAFSVGTMGKRSMSKKEMEEQRKKEQEEAAAQAFEEFVATFQEAPSKTSKVWVKAGTYDAGKRQEDTKEKGKLYKPQSRLSESIEKMTSAERAQEYARLLSDRKPDRPGKRKEREKKKSNLELFKEELKLIQEEREERHKYKGVIKQMDDPESGVVIDESKIGSFDCGDPTTTNLYLGNLHPKITEQQLMEVFGKYGPLASIKIMWPRSDEEKARARNCGFVAFMNRKDGERALRYLNGKDVMGYEMKLGWGKGVPIPPHPIYIPPAMMELTMPPPPSGLPFNAQPLPRDRHKVPRMRSDGPYTVDPDDMDKMEKILPQALVKVVIPTERNLLMLIHHTIEFVIREGPMFEAMIMNRELNNPMFRFLFENQSPAHIYYRWKLYSMLQGDIQNKWRTSEFRMFKGGSIWRPPPMNPYTQGMPDELVEPEVELRKGSLSPTQRDRLEDLIRNMTPERLKVAEVMVFCMEHSEAADEICDCIQESLCNPSTALYKKIARLYLISDILHNCGVKITNASYYRRGLEARLIPIFSEVHQTYRSIESRMKAEGFRMRIMKIFQAWEDWAVYSKDFLIRIQNAFLGLTIDQVVEEPESESEEEQGLGEVEQEVEDLEDNEDLDGVPLDGAALLKGALNHQPTTDDIDGIPMAEEDIDGTPMEGSEVDGKGRAGARTSGPGFVLSRWETVDPDLVEAQAMTTSKWETLEQANNSQDDSQEEDTSNLDIRDSNDDRRAKLREIELKVMQYQDELESGKRSLKYNFTIAHQVEHYRRKLLRKAEKGGRKDEKKEKEKEKRDSRKSSSPDEARETLIITTRKSKRTRSDSDSPTPVKKSHRSRSRSPRKRKASKSPHSRKSSPTRSKRGSPSSSRKRRSRSSSTPPSSRSKYRSPSPRSPAIRKHSTPPRKHKHKHKSSY
uniref:U2 snRNP-associated SURP motif-containing protein n=1 Tax=Graphocephala atropunctata TaxID=36148 RepID=A0A1B6MMK8_9HEMI